ncbi:MAG: hypothetical protein RLZZ517_37 [Candidatus Parcubacteria bacterium]|jgi:hypothetical protein
MKEAPRTYRWSHEILLALALTENLRFTRTHKPRFFHKGGRRGKRGKTRH